MVKPSERIFNIVVQKDLAFALRYARIGKIAPHANGDFADGIQIGLEAHAFIAFQSVRSVALLKLSVMLRRVWT